MSINLDKINSLLGRAEDSGREELSDPYDGILPESVEIDGKEFSRPKDHLRPQDGYYKVVYTAAPEIALLPNPLNDDIDDLQTQVAVWKHNQETYRDEGLETAADFEMEETRINGDLYPYLRGDYNQHLIDIPDLSEGVRREKWEEIVDYVIELDRLKREGEIATAEPEVFWENALEDYDIIINRPVYEDGEVIQDHRTSTFGERPHLRRDDRHREDIREGDYILYDFMEALQKDERLERYTGSDRDIYLAKDIYPRKTIMENGIPCETSKSLLDSLSYDGKRDTIVVDDLGEYNDSIFSDNMDTRFSSGEEFLQHHNITGYSDASEEIPADD